MLVVPTLVLLCNLYVIMSSLMLCGYYFLSLYSCSLSESRPETTFYFCLYPVYPSTKHGTVKVFEKYVLNNLITE